MKKCKSIIILVFIIQNSLFSQTFETIVEDKDVSFSSIAFQNPNRGWAVGWGGTIYKYEDGVWSKYESPVKQTLNRIFVNKHGEAWIVGEYGTILKLVDNEWIKIPVDTNEGLNDIYIDHDSGYIVGNNGCLFKLEKNKWKKISVDTDQHLYRISFDDKQNGFILGWNRTVIKICGDILIHVKQSDIEGMEYPYYYFYAIEYTGKNKGYLFGSYIVSFDENKYKLIKNDIPVIFDSQKNASRIWLIGASNVYKFENDKAIEIKSKYYQHFKSICFSSPNIGWIAAEEGLILKFQNLRMY